jgi:hypothetical protein
MANDKNFKIKNGLKAKQYLQSVSTGSTTLDLSTASSFEYTATTATTFTFSNPAPTGYAVGFALEVNNTNGDALTWPASVKWDLNTAPTSAAGKEFYTFISTDGGTTYYGKQVGKAMSNVANVALAGSGDPATAPGGGGGSAPDVADVFSVDLYTGNGSSTTVTNGIDFSGEGGMIINKGRVGASNFWMSDTERTLEDSLIINDNLYELNKPLNLTAFNSNGFTCGDQWNYNTGLYATYSFRKAPAFFDVVTYTGTSADQTITHSLGVEPGMIWIKDRENTQEYVVYHSASGSSVHHNLRNANETTSSTKFNSYDPTDADFQVNGGEAGVNVNGTEYVAYIFANDTSANGVIRTGSYTGNGSASGPSIDVGWEPQWVLVFSSQNTGVIMADTTRLWDDSADIYQFDLSNSNAENQVGVAQSEPTSVGFDVSATGSNWNSNTLTYYYTLIRAEGV